MQLLSSLSVLLLGQVCLGAHEGGPETEPQDYSKRFTEKYGSGYVDNFGVDREDGAADYFQKYMREFAPEYLNYTRMQKADDAQYRRWVQMGRALTKSPSGGESSGYASMAREDFASDNHHRDTKKFTSASDVDQASGSGPNQVLELAAAPVDKKAKREAEAWADAASARREEGSDASVAREAIEQLRDLLPKGAASKKVEAQKIAAAIVAGVEEDLQQQHEELRAGWDRKLEALRDERLLHANEDEVEQVVGKAEDADHRLHDLDHEAVKKMRHAYEESRSQAKAEARQLGKRAKEAAQRANKLGALVEHHQRKAGISEGAYERAEEENERSSERLEDAAEAAREQVEDALEQRYQDVEDLVEKHMEKFADKASDLHQERRDAVRRAQKAMLEARHRARDQEGGPQADKGAAAAAADKATGQHSSPEKQEEKKDQKSSSTVSTEEASNKDQGTKAPTQFLAWNSRDALSPGTSGRVLPVDVFATVALLGCVIVAAGAAFHAKRARQMNIEEQPALG